MINRIHLEMIKLYRGDPKRIQHFCKVHSYAKLIAETENVDNKCLFIIEAAALTHDIGIHFCEEKYGNCNGKLQEKEGPAIAEKLLGELGFDQDVSDRVQYLIAHHHTYNNIDEIDYQILVEADFLVNIMEDGLSKEAALKAYHNIFKTTSTIGSISSSVNFIRFFTACLCNSSSVMFHLSKYSFFILTLPFSKLPFCS